MTTPDAGPPADNVDTTQGGYPGQTNQPYEQPPDQEGAPAGDQDTEGTVQGGVTPDVVPGPAATEPDTTTGTGAQTQQPYRAPASDVGPAATDQDTTQAGPIGSTEQPYRAPDPDVAASEVDTTHPGPPASPDPEYSSGTGNTDTTVTPPTSYDAGGTTGQGQTDTSQIGGGFGAGVGGQAGAVPSAMAAPTAAAGPASAVVTFVPLTGGAIGGSPIRRYEILGSTGGTTTVAANATSATVDNLTPGEHYTFQVRGVNDQGGGPWSPASGAITPTQP